MKRKLIFTKISIILLLLIVLLSFFFSILFKYLYYFLFGLLLAIIYYTFFIKILNKKNHKKITDIALVCYDTQFEQLNDLISNNYIVCKRIYLNDKLNFLKKIWNFIKQICAVDIVYFGYGITSFPWKIIISKILGKKIVIHWIGTDVLKLYNCKYKIVLKYLVSINFACSRKICDELLDNNIKAYVIPIVPNKMDYELSEVPKKHGVLFYLPNGREDFYGLKYLRLLSEKYCNIDFYVVGNTSYDFSFSNNIHNLGKISLEEMNTLYNKISILFRVPEHDGLSLMLLEALIRGKNVFYCYEFPFVIKVDSVDKLLVDFSNIINEEPIINKGSREYVLKKYDKNNIKNDLLEILKSKKIIIGG